MATKKRILIVDDDPEIVDMHLGLLSDAYTLINKSDGENAIRYLEENRDIHLAIIDFKLPDMSGIEVLKQVKKMMPCTPAIFVTGHGSEEVAIRAFRHGARDYIKKPFSYSDFMRRIDFCLSLNDIKQVKKRKPVSADAREPAPRAGVAKTQSLEEARRYIDSNFATDIDLDKAAGLAGLSRFHFSRVFKQCYGSTFQSYLNLRRIEQAKRLLRDDSFTVTDVAFSVGYADLTHFERIFKKIARCTPTQFKRSQTAS